jgi:hypothetical protein
MLRRLKESTDIVGGFHACFEVCKAGFRAMGDNRADDLKLNSFLALVSLSISRIGSESKYGMMPLFIYTA